MKILVGLSNGLRSDNEPYQMLVVDVDSLEYTRPEWQEVNAPILSSCANVRVNLGNYKSIMQNPVEYLEAEFDVNRLMELSISQPEFQIINVYNDETGSPVLYRSVNSYGEVKMHHISELEYKKKFSIYGDNIEELPSYVKPEALKDAYEWWKKKDKMSIKNKRTRFAYEPFDTEEDMPVQLLYHYLIGVKEFQLGYHTITEVMEKNTLVERLHEYFLFKGTANVKLKESIPVDNGIMKEEIGIYGNKDPYPDKQKLGYYGATMSLICNCQNYPVFDIYTRPTSEMNYDKEGIEVTLDIIDGCMGIYNRFEEANCISDTWRLGENKNFFGVTLTNLLPEKLTKLSKNLQEEKERISYGHWSSENTHEWFQTMALALSTQYYSPELRNKLSEILKDYQNIFSTKLNNMINKISAKDTLEVMQWSEENIEKIMQYISFVKEGKAIQKSTVTMDQVKNLFTFRKNAFDLPDWLQIYSPKTIEGLGGIGYLKQFINTRGEESAAAFLSIWAEKLESNQRYADREQNVNLLGQTEDNFLKEVKEFENEQES